MSQVATNDMAERNIARGEEAVGKPFVLAHLSDLHLAPLPRPRVQELASKRLIGYINWQRSRHRLHRRDALDAITQDLRSEQPDHVAITGDLVNIALPAEFVHARRWLEAVGQPADVSVVPGNHDAYVDAASLHYDRHWSAYMAGDDALSGTKCDRQGRAANLTPPSCASRQGGAEKTSFPYLRRRGPVALIGVSTAVATPPFMATGRLGEPQIARMAEMLDTLRTRFRVVMIHHPPLEQPSGYHKRLVDAARFRQAIAAVGAELVIHGHDHVHALAWLAGKDGRVPVIGVPSASGGARTKHAGAYNLYRINGGPGAWRCEVVTRGLRPLGSVAELKRLALSG